MENEIRTRKSNFSVYSVKETKTLEAFAKFRLDRKDGNIVLCKGNYADLCTVAVLRKPIPEQNKYKFSGCNFPY